MSETNGHGKTYRQQLREAKAQVELARLQYEQRQLTAQSRLLEWWDDPTWNGWPSPFDLASTAASGGGWMPISPGRIDDKKDGSNRPFVWTDIDLDRARSLSQWLANKNFLAQGVLESLADYTVDTGYQYEAQPGKRWAKDATAQELAAQVQEFIEEFQGLNSIGEGEEEHTWADREWDAVHNSVRDGECFLRVFPADDGLSVIRPVWPEQVRVPPDKGGDPHWTFGKQHAPGDIERTLNYAIMYGDPADWELVPACEMAHLKLNTDSCVKRGLSDFYSTGQALEETVKLLRAMRVGATAMASIAWIEQHPGASQASLNDLVARARDLSPAPSATNPLTGREISKQQLEPGQRLLVGGGREYQSPPLAQNTPHYVAMVGACLRCIAARWKMPEYMISGDASNANYASTLVSGAPFVKRITSRQARYGRFFVRVMWKAVRNAAAAGRFIIGGHTFAYEEISRLVDLIATPPAVAISNDLQEAQIDQIDMTMGVLSKQTRRTRRGLDSDQERQQIAEEPAAAPAPQQEGGFGQGPFFPRIAGA